MTTLSAKELQGNIDALFATYREGKVKGCLFCGRKDLVLGDTIVADVFSKDGAAGSRKSLPVTLIVCRHCGYIHMLPATSIFGREGPL